MKLKLNRDNKHRKKHNLSIILFLIGFINFSCSMFIFFIDPQSRKVYNAEKELNYISSSIEDIKIFCNLISKSDWCKINFPRVKKIKVIKIENDKQNSYATFVNGTVKIMLPKWSRNQLTVCHELAHGFTISLYSFIPAPHGQEFCKIFLIIVKKWMTIYNYNRLKENFDKHKVKYGILGDVSRIEKA